MREKCGAGPGNRPTTPTTRMMEMVMGENHQSETIPRSVRNGIGRPNRPRPIVRRFGPQQIGNVERDEQREKRAGRIVEPASSQRRGRVMKSPVVKRFHRGRRPQDQRQALKKRSWNGMKEIFRAPADMTLSELVGEIDSKPPAGQPVPPRSRLFRAGLFPQPPRDGRPHRTKCSPDRFLESRSRARV